MRIVFIWGQGPNWNDTTLESGLGGSKAMMVFYARALARRGHKVTCLCPNDKEGVYHNVTWLNWDGQRLDADVVVSLRTPLPLQRYPHARVRALWANDQKCDALPLAVSTGVCNEIITISKHQTERYQVLYPEISAGLFFMSSAGVEYGAYHRTTKQRGLCLYMSTPERGLEYLLTLWPIIHRECPESLLKITSGFELYGWSPADARKYSRGLYEQMSKLDGVEYVGPIPRRELLQLQAEAQILLYPSTYDEMCCIAALEAASAEMAILTTNRAALSERVIPGLTGLLVDGDPSEECYRQDFIAHAVSLLSPDSRAAVMGRAGRISVAQHDYAVLAQQWEERWTT